MINPNSPANRLKKDLIARWSSEDYPGATPRFQPKLLAKDVAIFLLLPILSVILFKACENAASNPGKPKRVKKESDFRITDSQSSQIIVFGRKQTRTKYAEFAMRAPGSLVKLRLLNSVEIYSNAPVHAQVVDGGLGRRMMGGTLIGDATADTNFERINITFRFARDPRRNNIAIPISARALSLNGTLGVVARKKEGFLARATIGSAHSMTQDIGSEGGSADFKDVLIRALTAGLISEFGSKAKVEQNRAKVLTLTPATEFFAELTDFFPRDSQ